MKLFPYRKPRGLGKPDSIWDTFGIRSLSQVRHDLGLVLGSKGERYQSGWTAIGAIRPRLVWPALLGLVPEDGLSPIYNLFDRVGGGNRYSQRTTRDYARDFRGGKLSYDDHDGVDFVCPVGSPLCAAASGHVVMIRDQWLRGGLTVAVDHGSGILTQYTHCSKPLVRIGQEVKRGETVALSGLAGADMTFYVLYAPAHVHFMTWQNGTPVDPYLAEGEDDRAGTWIKKNTPEPFMPSLGEAEPIPEPSRVDEEAVDRVVASCTDDNIARELAALSGNYAALAAVLEDALHHDDFAWPDGYRAIRLRPEMPEADVRLSMPLSGSTYRGAKFGDVFYTTPPHA
jgi:hypothetical protein